jgi:hypothetical protein
VRVRVFAQLYAAANVVAVNSGGRWWHFCVADRRTQIQWAAAVSGRTIASLTAALPAPVGTDTDGGDSNGGSHGYGFEGDGDGDGDGGVLASNADAAATAAAASPLSPPLLDRTLSPSVSSTRSASKIVKAPLPLPPLPLNPRAAPKAIVDHFRGGGGVTWHGHVYMRCDDDDNDDDGADADVTTATTGVDSGGGGGGGGGGDSKAGVWAPRYCVLLGNGNEIKVFEDFDADAGTCCGFVRVTLVGHVLFL